jgi:hypothetical protein
MVRFLLGTFFVLHGLVHFWYVTLSQRLVEFQPEMGWSGNSWILSNPVGDSFTRLLAGGLFSLAALAFTASGIGVYIQAGWTRPVLIAAAVLSSAVIFLFWDGKAQMLVEKGLLGLLINLAILAGLLFFR